jgi:hypothetical protein
MYLEALRSMRLSSGVEPMKTESVGQQTCYGSERNHHRRGIAARRELFTYGIIRYRRHFCLVSSGREVWQLSGKGLHRKTPHCAKHSDIGNDYVDMTTSQITVIEMAMIPSQTILPCRRNHNHHYSFK